MVRSLSHRTSFSPLIHLFVFVLLLWPRTEEDGVRLPSFRISFASQMEAFAVLMELSLRSFLCDGQRLSVEGLSETPEKTAVHVSSFTGSIDELQDSFGGLPGFRGAIIGESCALSTFFLTVFVLTHAHTIRPSYCVDQKTQSRANPTKVPSSPSTTNRLRVTPLRTLLRSLRIQPEVTGYGSYSSVKDRLSLLI